jgi:hypothetical protein
VGSSDAILGGVESGVYHAEPIRTHEQYHWPFATQPIAQVVTRIAQRTIS